MSGVEYTKKLNRQNEIYQKNLRDLRNSHQEQVEGIKNQSESKIKSQSSAHLKDRSKIEKEAAATIDNYKTEQQKSLKEKSKAYEMETEKLKSAAHKRQNENLKEWRNKFSELKSTFDQEKINTEKANNDVKDQLAKNYNKNLENIKMKSKEDLDRFVETTSKTSDDTAGLYVKEKRGIIDRHNKEMTDIYRRNLTDKSLVLDRGQEDIRKMREDQKNKFLADRDRSKEKFDNFIKNQNNKREEFEANRIQKLNDSHRNDNLDRNVAFSKRLIQVENENNHSVKKLKNQQKVEKISQHAINHEITADQKANEREQIRKQKQRIIAKNNENSKSYEKKIDQLTKKNQDAIQDMRLDFADEKIRREKEITETFRQREVKDRISDKVKEDQHATALAYSEDRAKDRIDTLKTEGKDKVRNLKEDFNKSMELAQIKARKDFEKNREETVKEKAELQQRLHEQNSKSNTYLKKVMTDKMAKMAEGYEKQIFELENKNKMISSNAQDAIRNISEQAHNEINRQREISKRSAKAEVEIERTNASTRERALRKTMNKSQADFESKMTEIAAQSRKRLKDTTRRLELEKLEQARKYQDINDQDRKFFEREVARIKASSDSEKEALVTQYEDRIKSLMQVQRDKIKEIQEFDKLNNQA